MNRDEDLLEALGDAANERDEEDDRWWAAVEAEDAAALPEGAVDALRPLDDAEMDDIVGDLLGRMGASASSEAPLAGADVAGVIALGAAKATEGAAGALAPGVPGTPEAGPIGVAGPAEDRAEAKVVSISSARRWGAPAAALLAAAAAILLFVLPADPTALPHYSLDVRSGEKVVRSDEAPTGDVTTYSDGAIFDFVLVPDTTVTEDVALVAVVIGEGGARAWNAPTEALTGGTLRVRGKVGEQLDLAPGAWRVVFLVGAKGAMPKDPVAAMDDSDLQRFEAKILIRE